MYRKSFPKCKVEGDTTPLFEGLKTDLWYAVPKKCSTCEYLMEGSCTRNIEQMAGYLHLDAGSCGINGNTKPIAIDEIPKGNPIFVPEKCVNCEFMSRTDYNEYACKKDADLWGSHYRTFDWGDWQPDYPVVGIRRLANLVEDYLGDKSEAVITREIILLIQNKKHTAAMKLYKDLNKCETIREALDAIELIREKLKTAE